MEQNSEILEFMNSEVQFFQNFLSELTETEVVVVDIAEELELLSAPAKRSSANFIPKNKEASKRYNKDTNKYDNRPLDPDYANKYYANHRYLVQCDVCGAETKKLTLWRHKKTNKCKKLAESNQNSQ